MNATPELSHRAENALKNTGISLNKQDVRSAIEQGKLKLTRPRNLGITTLNELRSWVGLTPFNPYSQGGVRDLKFKLAIAREALTKIINSSMDPRRIESLIEETLKQTAP